MDELWNHGSLPKDTHGRTPPAASGIGKARETKGTGYQRPTVKDTRGALISGWNYGNF